MSAPDHSTFTQNLQQIIQTDSKIKNLIQKIPHFNLKTHLDTINRCSEISSLGSIPAYYDGSKINFCLDNLASGQNNAGFKHSDDFIKVLLRHELVHLYDHQIRKLDFTQTQMLKESELRAYFYSDYCNWENRSLRKSLNSEKQCIRKMTINSLSQVVDHSTVDWKNVRRDITEILKTGSIFTDLPQN